jgi:hemerythrin-like metal-binding protein
MIGHDRIDSDHRVLIGLIGDIEEMLEDASVTDKAKETYDIFLSFLSSHCVFEESLMRQLPSFYTPRIEEHCRHHAVLIEQAKSVSAHFAGGRPTPDLLKVFQKTVISITRDLIMDDVELVGNLLHEQQLSFSA